jgi:hypothetical protein
MRKIQILTVLAAAIGAAWLTMLVDNGLGLTWTDMAVRNWEQYGLLDLHGKMVCNVGGFQAETNPDYYPGHQPTSLYPAYFCYHLLAATGLEFLPYYAILAAMVLLSIWCLLGRTEAAFWLAAIAVITPGFLRWQPTLDPNLTAVMFGFPFCVAVIGLLQRPTLNWRQVVLLFALILVYSAINWTTIFVHAMIFMTLLVLPRVPWRHFFLYAGLAAFMAGAVLVVSVASKLSHARGAGAGLATMLQGYGWGNSGYGVGLTMRTALIRLFAVNLIGLLPVLVYLVWQWYPRRQLSPAGMIFLLPVLVPIVEVLGMRNYFAHHPWVSVNFFLLGIILAAAVWKERAGLVSGVGNPRLPTRVAIFASAFAYSFLVLTLGHLHDGRELAFITLVRNHTARDATIVVRRDMDPELINLSPRLSYAFDRHVIVVSDGDATRPEAGLSKSVILTGVAPPPEKIIAQTDLSDNAPPFLKNLVGWYTRNIAHRQAGDQMEIGGQKYFLCQTAN